jgi:A/G-specific adenine glycosylase
LQSEDKDSAGEDAFRLADKHGLTLVDEQAFRKVIYNYYRKHRRDFPWRKRRNPYRILVSEIMLQQTQTQRVVEKYEAFIRHFPDFLSLNEASLQEVLTQWQGLGYNRRAIALKRCAEAVIREYGGRLPSSVDELIKLPGIGKATASSISAFAFNKPAVFIETNIRAVFIYFFFRESEKVSDTDILPLVEKTLDASNPREWYSALMDYGVMLKKAFQNPARKSMHHKKQSRFEGSNRQLRGRILKTLLIHPDIFEKDLIKKIGTDSDRLGDNLLRMEKEGLIQRKRGRLSIA